MNVHSLALIPVPLLPVMLMVSKLQNVVAESERELREAGILQSIRMTFAEKGFDGASMQDLARAAGMSVGNFYRYFPSKTAIVEAIILRDLEELRQRFRVVLEADDPLAALRFGLSERIAEESEGCQNGPLWAEINAAAARKQDLAHAARGMEAAVRQFLIEAFARITGFSEAEAEARFGAHARVIVMLVKAISAQGAEEEPQRAELVALMQRMADGLLDEVAGVKR